MPKRLDVYNKTRGYIGMFQRGEIDQDELFYRTNRNIVSKSHCITDVPGQEEHDKRQQLRRTMWSCMKTAFPQELGPAKLSTDIRGFDFMKKRSKKRR